MKHASRTSRPSPIAQLLDRLRADAATLERRKAPGAEMLESCAAEIEAWFEAFVRKRASLKEAAQITGRSTTKVWRDVQDGRLERAPDGTVALAECGWANGALARYLLGTSAEAPRESHSDQAAAEEPEIVLDAKAWDEIHRPWINRGGAAAGLSRR